MLSPRRFGLDAWRPKAHSLLSTSSKLPPVVSVLVSAIVLLGPKEFFVRFGATQEHLLGLSQDDRKKHFTGPKRVPTPVALSCLQIGWDFHNSVKIYPKHAVETRRKMFDKLQETLAYDDIAGFQVIDQVADINSLVDLIIKIESWTKPLHALLGVGSKEEQLEMMGCMYECEPTQAEETEKLATDMINGATEVGISCVNLARGFIVELFTPTPAPPLAKERTWEEILVEFVPVAMKLVVWIWFMVQVGLAWLRGLYVKLTIIPEDNEQTAMANIELSKNAPTNNIELPLLLYVLFLSISQSEVSYYTRTLLVCSLSLHMAHDMPLHRMHMRFAQEEKTNSYLTRSIMCFIIIVYVGEVSGTVLNRAWIRMIHTRNNVRNVHMPFFSQACALCAMPNFFQTRLAPWLYLLINVAIFAVMFLLSLHPDYNTKNVNFSSMVSLYAARIFCILVIFRHLEMYMTTMTWESVLQETLFIEYCMCHHKVLAYYLLACGRDILMSRL